MFVSQSNVFTRLLVRCYFHNKTKCFFSNGLKTPYRNININKQRYSSKCGENLPFKMKLETTEFKSVITDEVKLLKELFEKNGFELRIVGGAVRDLLLGNVPSDLDFATTATPDEMRDLFNKHEIRLINLRGESHGTITPRINNVNYEITTLRVDEVTNGRRAIVRFTKDWYEDANRRDLTINAMFLDLDGTIYDYFNGLEDLKNRRILFVGEPSSRIQEDYLRILRYFRFFGRISENPDNHDEKTLLAIKENANGLSKISGERIQSELFKIVSGNYGIELLKKMLSLDLGQYIGMPTSCNIEELDRVVNNIRTNNFVVEPITILSALFNNSDDVTNFVERIKPSRECRDLAYFIVEERSKKEKPENHLKYYQKLLMFSKTLKFTKTAICQYLRYSGDAATLKDFEGWDSSTFPIKGNDILQIGITDCKQTGFIMRELMSKWIDSDFKLAKEDLMSQVLDISANYDSNNVVYIKNKKLKRRK